MTKTTLAPAVPKSRPSFVNMFHPDDWEHITEGVNIVKKCTQALWDKQCHLDVPVEQRYWEYGTGIQLMLNNWSDVSKLDVVDVGSGWSPFGPSVAMSFKCNVAEYEPQQQMVSDRIHTNSQIVALGGKPISVHAFSLETMPLQDYDAVFCISVLEHVAKHIEKDAWKSLAERVRKGGIFFMTTDVVDDPNVPHIFDNLRAQPNYTLKDMQERVEMLVDLCDMEPIGTPDYRWRGVYVHDFNFFRAGFKKVK